MKQHRWMGPMLAGAVLTVWSLTGRTLLTDPVTLTLGVALQLWSLYAHARQAP